MEYTSSPLSASVRSSRTVRGTVLPAAEMVVMASRSRESTRTSGTSEELEAARASAAPRTSSASAADSVITSRTSASVRIHCTWEAESVS